MLGETIHDCENAFGAKRVTQHGASGMRYFLHDGTLHGLQCVLPGREREPLGYFHREGLFGCIFELFTANANARLAVIGLGAGCLAAYVTQGQTITFVEIDPEVISIARDPRYFSFVEDCRGTCRILEGDGLDRMANIPDGELDLLMHDAFVGDVLSDHLVSDEAIVTYLRKTSPDGILAFHVSLMSEGGAGQKLKGTLVRRLQRLNLAVLFGDDMHAPSQPDEAFRFGTRFLVAARSADRLQSLQNDPRWQPIPIVS